MIKGIQDFMYLLGADASWGYLIVGLLVVKGIVRSLYPWQPKSKSKKTKDKDGNEITIYYRLDE